MPPVTGQPPKATDPAPAAGARAALSKAERAFLDKLAAGQSVAALVRTGTTVDVGEWFRRGRVVGVCWGDEWVMFAVGRRPFVERIPTRALTASVYNHLVGELVLAPAPEARLKQLRMSPVEAGRVLRWMLSVCDEAVKQ
jgi:hypothetical protein